MLSVIAIILFPVIFSSKITVRLENSTKTQCVESILENIQRKSVILEINLKVVINVPSTVFNTNEILARSIPLANDVVVIETENSEEFVAIYSKVVLGNSKVKLITICQVCNFRWDDPVFRNRTHNLIFIRQNKWNSNHIYHLSRKNYHIITSFKKRLIYLTQCSIDKVRHFGNVFSKIEEYIWRGKHVKVLVNYSPPYAYYNNLGYPEGIDVKLMQVISKKMEFNVQYIIRSKYFLYWGNKFEYNKSYNGLLSLLLDREFDATIGGFHSAPGYDLDFDITYPYDHDGLFWVVPRSQPISKWRRLLQSFKPAISLPVWLCMLLLLFFCWYFYGEPFVNTFLVFFQIFLEVGLPHIPKFKIIFMAMVLCLFVTSTYLKANLVLMMQSELYEHQIDSPKELMESKLELALLAETLRNFDRKFSNEARLITCEGLSDCLAKVCLARTAATLIIGGTAEQMLPQYVDATGMTGHLIRKPQSEMLIQIFFTKNHPVFEQFNAYSIRLNEAGFIKYWNRKSNLFNDDIYKSLRIDSEHKRTDINEMVGAFIFLICGLGISLAVFVVEVLNKRFICRSIGIVGSQSS